MATDSYTATVNTDGVHTTCTQTSNRKAKYRIVRHMVHRGVTYALEVKKWRGWVELTWDCSEKHLLDIVDALCKSPRYFNAQGEEIE